MIQRKVRELVTDILTAGGVGRLGCVGCWGSQRGPLQQAGNASSTLKGIDWMSHLQDGMWRWHALGPIDSGQEFLLISHGCPLWIMTSCSSWSQAQWVAVQLHPSTSKVWSSSEGCRQKKVISCSRPMLLRSSFLFFQIDLLLGSHRCQILQTISYFKRKKT